MLTSFIMKDSNELGQFTYEYILFVEVREMIIPRILGNTNHL